MKAVMGEVIISGVQFLVMELFNIYVIKKSISRKQFTSLIIASPFLAVLSGGISAISPILSGLVLTMGLVIINHIILKVRTIQVLFPMLFLLTSLILFLIISDLLPMLEEMPTLNELVHIGAFLIGGIVSIKIQNYVLKRFSDLLNYKRINQIILRGYLAILLILVFTTLQVESRKYTNINSIIVEILFITLLLLVILTLILTFLKEVQRRRLASDKKEIERLESYAEVLERSYKQLRKVKHNYVNIITTSLLFLEDKEYEGLKKYYTESLKLVNEGLDFDELRINDIQNIKNSALKGIIAYKLIQAYHQNLKIHFECIESVENIEVSQVKLVEIIGILMDNAIEYIKMNGGKIDVLITVKDDYKSILIRNTLRTEKVNLSNIFSNGFTTKKGHEGIGLNTLREIISKEDNLEVVTTIDDGFITQEVLFN